MSKSILDLINKARLEASDAYQKRVPEITRENITKVRDIITNPNNLDLFNEFSYNLIRRIALTIINNEIYNNPLKRFKKGQLPPGGIVQIVDSEMLKPEGAYDPEGKNPLGRRIHNNVQAFASQTRKDKYVLSISPEQLYDAFTSLETLDSFVNKQLQDMTNGAEYDEYLITRELLKNQEMYVADVAVPYPSDSTKAEDLIVALKDLAGALAEPSKLYNVMTMRKWTPLTNQVLIIRNDVKNRIDVKALAGFYNLEKGNIPQTIQSIFTFGGDNVIGWIVDENYLNIRDILIKMEKQRNSDGLFDNYFYHVWQIFYINVFKNAVRLIDDSVVDGAKASFYFEDANVIISSGAVTHSGETYNDTIFAYKGDKVVVNITYKNPADKAKIKVKFNNADIATGGALTGTINTFDPAQKFSTEKTA